MTSSNTAQDPQTLQSRANRHGYLMLAAILVPMALAYGIYKTGIGMPTGTINKGILLEPARSVYSLGVTTAAGDPVAWPETDAHWRLLVPVMGSCDAGCDQALYLTRQVHKRLNEKYPKVERWALVDSASWQPGLAEKLAQDYYDARILLVDAKQWQEWRAAASAEAALFLMVDPDGFAMMQYQQQHTGNDLLADLKRMLKLSREH